MGETGGEGIGKTGADAQYRIRPFNRLFTGPALAEPLYVP